MDAILNLISPIDQGFESREKLLFCQLLSFVLMTIPREFTSSSESLRKIDLGSVLHLGGRLKPLIPLSAKPYLGRFSEDSPNSQVNSYGNLLRGRRVFGESTEVAR